MDEWYLVHTKAGKENAVKDQLSQWLPNVLLPTLKVRVHRWSKPVNSVAPLFPCYLFAAFSTEHDLCHVRYTSGVREVVSGGREPLAVPSSIVQELKDRCANGPIELPTKPLQPGDRVTIAEGALRGFEAVFDQYLSGPQRVAVLLSSMWGAAIRVILPASALVAGLAVAFRKRFLAAFKSIQEDNMNRADISMAVTLVTVALAILVGLAASAANLTGGITDQFGKPVQGMSVILQDQAGHPIQSARSGADGAYAMRDLKAGTYRLALDPGKLGFNSGTPMAAVVPDQGLTVNWVVSATAQPIALARSGSSDQVAAADPFGFTWPEFLEYGGVFAAGMGGLLGGVAATGGFSGGSGVASSSK